MQTLQALHDEAELAHLDLTSNNVMFSSFSGLFKVSDVRVIDFGFAQDSPGQGLIHDAVMMRLGVLFGLSVSALLTAIAASASAPWQTMLLILVGLNMVWHTQL